jgi:hypothetical protein
MKRNLTGGTVKSIWSGCPPSRGWVRSKRFELLFKVGDKGKLNTEITPKWLAIHEFGADGLPGDRSKALNPVPELTKKIVGNAIKVDSAKFTLIRGIGDETASL